MKRNAARDMTTGSPTRLIFGFFLPLLFGLLFQQLYNMVDTMVVGLFLGVNALAGVGSTGALSFLVMGFCIGVCNGFVIPVAQKFGERDWRGMKRYVTNAIMLAGALSAVITAIVSLLCRQLLIWMNTPSDVIDQAYHYIIIIFLGIPITFFYNVFFGIIRSMGDSRTPVVYLVICSLLNVALDLLFILVFGLGVSGAALATVISQCVSMLLCVRYIRHCDLLILEKSDWRLDLTCVKRLFSMGIPTGLQFSVTAIGSLMLQTSVNTLGSMAVASIAAAVKVNQLFFCPFDAMGSTMATYGGQNIGARKLDRIGRGLRSCSVMGIVYSLCVGAIIFFLGDKLTLMFVDGSETAVIQNAHMFLRFNSIFLIPLAFVNIVRYLIQGLGYSKLAVFAGVCEMFARGSVAFILVPKLGFPGACAANPAAWIAACLFLFPAYAYVMKQLRAKLTGSPAA